MRGGGGIRDGGRSRGLGEVYRRQDLAKFCVADLSWGGCSPPTELRRGGPAFMVARSQTRPRPVPDPSGKVLAKLRGKGLAKLNAKTPGKAAWQSILARAAKLQNAQTPSVSCGKSLLMQGIVSAAKISWHLHYGVMVLWCYKQLRSTRRSQPNGARRPPLGRDSRGSRSRLSLVPDGSPRPSAY